MVEGVTFTPKVKEALAYPVRSRMEDRACASHMTL
jgi:hypothetical protein